jgi:hypothetical protein
MADVTGFEMIDRAGGWSSEPFTVTSGNHVSTYEWRGTADRAE